MKNLYKKTESITKIIILTTLLLFPVLSSAEIVSDKWTKSCVKEGASCSINIKNEYDLKNSDKKGTLATISIRLITTTEKKMALLDAEENTYKLSEENKFTPIIFINLPLNIDLKKNPLVQIDDLLKLFKDGKEINVVIGA